jgi:hypothetical protein
MVPDRTVRKLPAYITEILLGKGVNIKQTNEQNLTAQCDARENNSTARYHKTLEHYWTM